MAKTVVMWFNMKKYTFFDIGTHFDTYTKVSLKYSHFFAQTHFDPICSPLHKSNIMKPLVGADFSVEKSKHGKPFWRTPAQMTPNTFPLLTTPATQTIFNLLTFRADL